MKKGKTYKDSNGIEYMMHPCTRMYISQGSRQWSHSGCMANDVTNECPSTNKSPYYAGATMKCMGVYPEAGQSWWQTCDLKGNQKAVWIKGPNGSKRKEVVNLMFAHDDTLNCFQGQIIPQGSQIGNMGVKGIGTGIHVHIQVGIGNVQWGAVKGSFSYQGKTYPCYGFTNEPYDLDDIFFIDDTEILNGAGGDWKKIPKSTSTTTTSTASKPATQTTSTTKKEEWVDDIVRVGDTVKSISLKISGVHNGFVLVKNLGGWLPDTDVSEAPDTGDGVPEGLLTNDTCKVYLDPVKVEAVDTSKDWVRVHGYWVPAKYLLVKRTK